MAESRKELYNKSPVDLRTKVRIDDREEIAMKPYWYYRNGRLHIRYTVDRCVELSEGEKARLKVELSSCFDKQEVLAKAWYFQVNCLEKKIIHDGIADTERRIKGGNNGLKN